MSFKSLELSNKNNKKPTNQKTYGLIYLNFNQDFEQK